MSSNSNSADTTTLGAKVNFFDSQEEEFDTSREPKDETKPEHDTDDEETDIATVDEMLCRGDTHDQVRGVNRDQWIAGSILRSYGNPPLYCPECWHEYDAAVELPDPEHYVPAVEVDHDFDTESLDDSREITKRDHRRHRHCPNCGTVTFGGTLGDRDTEEFREVIDYVLDAVDELVMSRREVLEKAAMERKAAGKSDQANMEQLIRELRYADGD